MLRKEFIFISFVFLPLLVFAHGAPEGGEAHDHHGAALFHEETDVREGLAVNFNISPAPVRAGEGARLDFFVNEKPGNKPIPFYFLEEEHTKLMHVVGIREDLNEFFHIHPEPSETPGLFTANHVFSKPGNYKVWSEIKRGGIVHTYGHPVFSVEGEGIKYAKEVSGAKNVIVGNYQVALEAPETIGKNWEYDINFTVKDLVGDGVELEEYLGGSMHLFAMKDDLSVFLHLHPEQEHAHAEFGDVPNRVSFRRNSVRNQPSFLQEALANGPHGIPAEAHNFHITFPAAGFYKLFVQFRPHDAGLAEEEALTAAFWVEVKESAISASAIWLILFFVSAALTALLSYGVYKFIQVNPKKIKAVLAE